MRTLLLFGTVVAALLFPWSSAFPPSRADAPQATAAAASTARPAVILSPQIGIVPLEPAASNDLAGVVPPDLAELPAQAEVVCEDGVCRVPGASEAVPAPIAMPLEEPATAAAAHLASWDEARARLEELGATRYCLETWEAPGQFRFSCAVPTADGPRKSEQFEATAIGDLQAVAEVLDQIAAWQAGSMPVAADSVARF